MNISKWLEVTTMFVRLGPNVFINGRPDIVCSDGFILSVQASKEVYCTPRADLNDGNYSAVEISYISKPEPLLDNVMSMYDADSDCTIYMNVPVKLVNEILLKHGGISQCIDLDGKTFLTMDEVIEKYQ